MASGSSRLSANANARVMRASSRSFSSAGRTSFATDIGTSDTAMALDFLKAMQPPLRDETMLKLRHVLPTKHNMSLSVLAHLGLDGLKELGIDDITERAHILAAVSDPNACAPAPLGEHGEPVEVRAKVGFTQLSQMDTVNQTVNVRFFLDLYWNDPRVKGCSHVPDGIWRPSNCYIANQHGDMSSILHNDRPVLMDSETGLLLWPVEMCGALQNPMNLRAFPFDSDGIEVHIHQNEQSSRDEYLLRPFEGEEERQSVRFFFGVFDDLTEFDVLGFSKECYENVGGNKAEYTHTKITLHVARRWQYYIYKVAVPQLLCTVFCFSSLFYPIETEGMQTVDGIFNSRLDANSLMERNNVAATILLASFALLYVVAGSMPKTSYQTTMDLWVLMNMFIQFVVAFTSWMTTGVFFDISERAAANTNIAMFFLLIAVLIGTTVWLLGLPMLAALRRQPTDWPVTLQRENPDVTFHPFEAFVNVFPPWEPGAKNPVKLDPKRYGRELPMRHEVNAMELDQIAEMPTVYIKSEKADALAGNKKLLSTEM